MIDKQPKFNIIIGRQKTKAEILRLKDIFISKKLGKKLNIFSKNF